MLLCYFPTFIRFIRSRPIRCFRLFGFFEVWNHFVVLFRFLHVLLHCWLSSWSIRDSFRLFRCLKKRNFWRKIGVFVYLLSAGRGTGRHDFFVASEELVLWVDLVVVFSRPWSTAPFLWRSPSSAPTPATSSAPTTRAPSAPTTGRPRFRRFDRTFHFKIGITSIPILWLLFFIYTVVKIKC